MCLVAVVATISCRFGLTNASPASDNMSRPLNSLRSLILACLRPVAGLVRRLLTPPSPPVRFVWQEISQGPAAGTFALLPEGAPIADAIKGATYESKILSVITALVGHNDVCFDIGGHYGYFTLSLAKLAANGQVHTFEPVTLHAKRIRDAVQKSGLDNVTVHEVAMAGSDGEMTLRFANSDDADDSMAYLEFYGGVDTEAAHAHYENFDSKLVETRTLDSLANQLPLPQFLKIDAEGAEVSIIQSGLKLISSAKPRMLIEVHGIYESLGCAELLQSVGYRAVLLTDQKTTLPVLWIPNDDDEALHIVTKVLGHKPRILFDKNSVLG